MRLVLIEKNKYTVYENKRCIAVFELDETDRNCRPLTTEEVEKLRLDNYEQA
jgi:hypothetical protein